MEKLTAKEIIEKLKTNLSLEEIGFMDYDSEKLGLGLMEQVERYGGEGEGEKWYSVQYFKDHDVYIQIDGYYQSYHGTEFETDPYEVEPKEVVETKYVPKN